MHCVIRKLVDYTFGHFSIKEGIATCIPPSFYTYQDTKYRILTSLEQHQNTLCKTMDKKTQLLWITLAALIALNTMLDGVIMGSHGNVKIKRKTMLQLEKPKVSYSCSTNLHTIDIAISSIHYE